MRLNKFLAHCGVGSRRICDEIIFQNRVDVDGVTVNMPGQDIDPETQEIRVDGETVRLKNQYTYIILHKPAGCVTSRKDPHNEKTVMDLLPRMMDVRPCGRLDKDTTGTLLLTDDGDLLYRLTHPKFQVEKRYSVRLKWPPKTGEPEKELIRGITLEDGTRVRGAAYPLNNKKMHYLVVLKEGKKREVKRIFRHFGTFVSELHRSEFAGLSADGLKPGTWRRLSLEEIRHLRKIAGMTS